MELESFRYEFDVPDLRQVILSKTAGSEMSPVGFLAMRFADRGAEGLRETQEEISSKAKAYLINFSPPYKIKQLDQERMGVNYSAVVVGLSLQFVEDALIWGVFDKPGFVREHNKRIDGGMFYAPLQSDASEAQTIKTDDLRQMRELAREDKTLSIFFQEGYPLLPYFIQDHIGHVGNLEFIIERTLPIYHPVASRLLTPS